MYNKVKNNSVHWKKEKKFYTKSETVKFSIKLKNKLGEYALIWNINVYREYIPQKIQTKY